MSDPRRGACNACGGTHWCDERGQSDPPLPLALYDALENWANGKPGALEALYAWHNQQMRHATEALVRCPRCLGRRVITAREGEGGGADHWKCLCGDGTMRSLVSALEQERLKLIDQMALYHRENRNLADERGQAAERDNRLLRTVEDAQKLAARLGGLLESAYRALNVAPPVITRTPAKEQTRIEWRGRETHPG